MTHGVGFVVDDEESLRTVLGMLLRRQGYEVTTVSDGVEALEALSTQSYSVLLSDLRMPNLDGMSLLRRTLEQYPEMPVIMLTAHGTVDTAVEALERTRPTRGAWPRGTHSGATDGRGPRLRLRLVAAPHGRPQAI